MTNPWHDLKHELPASEDVKGRIRLIEAQVAIAVNNLTALRDNPGHEYLIDATITRIKSAFGIEGESRD